MYMGTVHNTSLPVTAGGDGTLASGTYAGTHTVTLPSLALGEYSGNGIPTISAGYSASPSEKLFNFLEDAGEDDDLDRLMRRIQRILDTPFASIAGVIKEKADDAAAPVVQPTVSAAADESEGVTVKFVKVRAPHPGAIPLKVKFTYERPLTIDDADLHNAMVAWRNR